MLPRPEIHSAVIIEQWVGVFPVLTLTDDRFNNQDRRRVRAIIVVEPVPGVRRKMTFSRAGRAFCDASSRPNGFSNPAFHIS